METCERETSTRMMMQQQKLNTHKGRKHNGRKTYHKGKHMKMEKFYIDNLSRQTLLLTPLPKTWFLTQCSYNFKTKYKTLRPTKQATQSSTHPLHTDNYHVSMVHKTQPPHFREKPENDLIRSKHVLKTTHYYCYN